LVSKLSLMPLIANAVANGHANHFISRPPYLYDLRVNQDFARPKKRQTLLSRRPRHLGVGPPDHQ
jgi:hypothetical protein